MNLIYCFLRWATAPTVCFTKVQRDSSQKEGFSFVGPPYTFALKVFNVKGQKKESGETNVF